LSQTPDVKRCLGYPALFEAGFTSSGDALFFIIPRFKRRASRVDNGWNADELAKLKN